MMSEKIVLTYESMQEYFRQSVEFIFLDRVEILPGQSAEGTKLVSAQDWYFKYHFPGNPVMPGVFQMEAIMQTGGLIINTLEGKKELSLLFEGCKDVRIYGSVRPGDVLKTSAVLLSYKRGIAKFRGESKVREKLLCTMEFMLISPGEMKNIMDRRGEKQIEVIRP